MKGHRKSRARPTLRPRPRRLFLDEHNEGGGPQDSVIRGGKGEKGEEEKERRKGEKIEEEETEEKKK